MWARGVSKVSRHLNISRLIRSKFHLQLRYELNGTACVELFGARKKGMSQPTGRLKLSSLSLLSFYWQVFPLFHYRVRNSTNAPNYSVSFSPEVDGLVIQERCLYVFDGRLDCIHLFVVQFHFQIPQRVSTSQLPNCGNW